MHHHKHSNNWPDDINYNNNYNENNYITTIIVLTIRIP